MSLQIDRETRSVSNGSFKVKKSGAGHYVYDAKSNEKKVFVPAPTPPAPVVLAAPVVS